MLLYGASGLRRGVHQITDWNQATLPDVAFLSSENAATNAPTTDFTYGVQTSFHRSGPNYRTQFVTSLYGNNAYWFRQLRDSAGWSTWVQMLHSGNFNSYALPLSGGTVTGPVEISTGATNGNYNEGLRLAIANNGWTGITFGSTGLAGAPTNGWFAARNPSNQFIISPADSNNTTGLTLNSGGNALWRNNILLHAGNYNSYAPTLTGTGASGTWGISITGTARGLDSSHYIARTGSSGNANTDFSNTPAGTTRISGDDANLTNGAGGAWWFYQHMRHSNASSTWGVQVAWGWEDNANILRTRNVGAGTFGSWVTYLNSANYNSYAPTLTGGNASGTWGISITGYAANGLDAWVHFDGLNPAGNGVAVNIQSNFNVLSVVRNSAGNFTVNFINALSSSNYAVFTSATVGSTGFSTQTTSSVVVFSQTVAGTPTNPSRMSVGAVIL
jgi:hypothetical protein